MAPRMTSGGGADDARLSVLLATLFAFLGAISTAEAAPLWDLPPIQKEVPGARVGWAADERSAVLAAEHDGKPVILLSVSANCRWCQILAENTLRCPKFNALAGQAHFLVVDRTDDPLVHNLEISGWPSISVLQVRREGINEVRRVVGMLDERTLLGYFAPLGLRPTASNPLGKAPTGLPAEHPDKCDKR